MTEPATQTDMLDVLIVGAGPVGLTTALACAKQGLKFRIIEKLQTPSTHSKALAIWAGTLEILAGLGIAERFVGTGLKVHAMRFFDMGRELGSVCPSQGVESRYPYPIIVPQSKTELLLTEALAQLGVGVERGMEFTGFLQQDDGVRCQVADSTGKVHQILSHYVVGCDGARSAVRHHLPVKFLGVTVESNMILADVRLTNPPKQSEVNINWTDHGPVVLFPVEKDLWRIFTTRDNLEDNREPTLDEFNLALKRSGFDHLGPHDPVWLSAFRVNERVVDQMRVGRVFLAGDAAHIHSPAGGQGMNTGMQDGYNLAWKLKLLIDGTGNPQAVAESYHQERHPVAVSVVEGTAKMLRQGTQTQGFKRFVRDTALSFFTHVPAFQKFAANRLSELTIQYTDSGLIRQEGMWIGAGFIPGSKPRDTAIQTLDGKPESLWLKLLHNDYTLLLFPGNNPTDQAVPTLNQIAEAIQVVRPAARIIGLWPGYAPAPQTHAAINWYRDTQGLAHDDWGVNQDPAWCLVRPDQYLAARSQPADVTNLVEALAEVVKRSR